MKNIFIKIQALLPLLKQYRWLLLPLIPFILLLIFLVSLFLQPVSDSTPLPTDSPTPTSSFIDIPLTPQPTNDLEELEAEENPEELPGFERKEMRSDGTTIYIYTSEKPDRPNITIRNSDNSLIFYRNLSTSDQSLMNIPLIQETFGQPDKVIQGSTYFGPEAQIYVYENSGLAFIVNPQTNETYEEQGFPMMSVEEYLQKFNSLN
jgi:hypothetical protein